MENKKLNLKPNVIEGDELRQLFSQVFSDMAKYVSRTYGPFGENSAYHDQGKIFCTKDGWTVEQEIIYSNNALANVIRKLIIDVSHSINIHAGDGTTTGVIAANEINKLILEYKDTHKIHAKFLSSAIEDCVDMICDKLREDAIDITNEEELGDYIYRIATVSLDWDIKYAHLIRDIYVKTKNPVIRVQNSGTESSYVTYQDGYDLSAKLISEFKVNEVATKTCHVDDPVILIFSYTIPAYLFEGLISVASYYAKWGREVVVLAPDFEKSVRDSYNALCVRCIKNNQKLPNLILSRYYAEYNIEREMLNDFCFLTGATTFTKDDLECESTIRDLGKLLHNIPPVESDFESQEDYEIAMVDYQSTVQEKMKAFELAIENYAGRCDEMSINDKTLIANGFDGMENSDAIEHRKEIIKSEIDKKLKDFTAKSIYTDEIKLKTLRLGKLNLSMGTIHVGGFGEYNLKAKRDALEDAINACSNAYLEGVIVGGGIAIPCAIDEISWSLYEECEALGSTPPETQMLLDILSIIREGFIQTLRIMIQNRYTDGIIEKIQFGEEYDLLAGENADDISKVIYGCMESKTPWNLITEKYDNTIIHPVKVEIEVLKGCLHLVLTTTTTNQLLYNGFEGIDIELEGMREVTEE